MTTPREREAACVCGQLRIRLAGDPQLVSSCHCFACQRRTGAVFGSTSFFSRSQIVSIDGKDRTFRRVGDSGRFLTFHFCPTCGSNVFWESESDSERISVAVGAFADPAFPMPARTVWAENKHEWLPFPETIPWHRRKSRLGSVEVCMQLKGDARFAVTYETIIRVWHNRLEMKFA